ncbi:uncharacterized protein BDW43DRAFT_317049 [Aspergillus alliaceus]|uniref:uncharacterized protein n=1 Tax=Petromyces alliaceus TaxID=209559 RepID=UPI0012A67A54|nr:uncharacterized protein BDW43DRAFT_317049 [Aspergillus alliaceus]KAB8227184.1 hypothetical protein BDW43DRAFT_317049 [Aspergillus alliaceus]
MHEIQDIYGNGTKCGKDIFYQTEAGSHFNLVNLIDKRDHERKRKILSSAFASKNVETWASKMAEKFGSVYQRGDEHRSSPPPEIPEEPDPKDFAFDYQAWTNLPR